MKLITTEKGIKKLVPENGMFLTNGETIADNEVWLGKLDSPDNWHEITPEEKAAIEEKKREEQEERLKKLDIRDGLPRALYSNIRRRKQQRKTLRNGKQHSNNFISAPR